MQIRFKKMHPDAVLPKYAKEGDAGLDLTAATAEYDDLLDQWVYSTGLAVELPPGYVGLIFPRSSVYKVQQSLANCVGVCDSGFRGAIGARFYSLDEENRYDVGDRILQLIIIPYPQIEPIFSEELTHTKRGTDGFGSSGR